MKKMFLSLGIAVAALMVVSCDKSDDVEALGFDTLKSASTVQGDGTHIFTTTATDLTPKELDGLLLMREEKKWLAMCMHSSFQCMNCLFSKGLWQVKIVMLKPFWPC